MLPTKPVNFTDSDDALSRRDVTAGGVLALLALLVAGWAHGEAQAAPDADDAVGPPFAPIALQLVGTGWVRDGASHGWRELVVLAADIRVDETGAWTMTPVPGIGDEPGPVYSGGPGDSARALIQLLADFARDCADERRFLPD